MDERPSDEQVLELIAATHYSYVTGEYPADLSEWAAEFVGDGDGGLFNALHAWRAERGRYGEPDGFEFACRWTDGATMYSPTSNRTLAVTLALDMRERQRLIGEPVNAVPVYRCLPPWIVLPLPKEPA